MGEECAFNTCARPGHASLLTLASLSLNVQPLLHIAPQLVNNVDNWTGLLLLLLFFFLSPRLGLFCDVIRNSVCHATHTDKREEQLGGKEVQGRMEPPDGSKEKRLEGVGL